jgi:hypothetical protein
MFYTTPETSSESGKSSSVGYETDNAETSNLSQENIQDNTVDTSKWTELLEEKGNSPMTGPNTLDDYGKDISLIHTFVETHDKEKEQRDELHKVHTEVYAESTVIGETSNTEGNYKTKLREHNTDFYTESADTDEESKRQENDKEGLQDNIELYTESAGTGQTDMIEDNNKEELQNSTEAYTEDAGAGEKRKRQGSDKEEEEDKMEVYSESTGTGEMSKKEGSSEEEMLHNTDLYTESISTGQTSKIEWKDKEEIQHNTEAYTENTGIGERRKAEGKEKEELQDNTEAYTESTGTEKTGTTDRNDEGVQHNTETYTENTGIEESSKIGGNDKEELQDNTEVYTESTGTAKTSNIDGNEKEELQVKSEVYTKNTGPGETSNMKGNDKEMQQDNSEIYAGSTDNGEASKRERNDKEELQQDDTEVYVESTDTAETKTERNDKEGLQEDSTEVFTENTGNSVPTHSSEEEKTDISSGKITNTIAETRFDEIATTPNLNILESEEVKNNDSLDVEFSSADASKTENNGMIKDGGAVWYIGEIRESSTESIMYVISQESEKHEITGNISEHNEGSSGNDPAQYDTLVNSTEEIVTGSTGGDEHPESSTGSGEVDERKYREDSTEAGNIETSSTTAFPDRYTQLTEHESEDTVPVVTFQSNMELHHMDLVVPGLDNTKLQVDYDTIIRKKNPMIGIDSEINAISDYSGVASINSEDDLNTSGLQGKTFQNSSEKSENINNDESSTSSLKTNTAFSTSNPTTDITLEFKNTERTEPSETTTVQSDTVHRTKLHLSVASLLINDSATKTQNEEITSSTVEPTTPDVLEGEHPLNAKESEKRTEQTEATLTETLQYVTAANSISDSNAMQKSKAVPHTVDEDVSHTVQTSESITESDWGTSSADENERSAGATEGSEKILGAVSAFMSNKTGNTTETSDILPKEWLKTNQVTTVTSADAINMHEDKSETTLNHDKAEEFTSTVNYSHYESTYLYESRSGDTTDQPKETDTTNNEWATESMLISISLENTDKFNNYSSNKNDSQISAHDFLNENRSATENGTDNASEETEATTDEQGISTISSYNSHEKEIPFWDSLLTQHNEEHNEKEGSGISATDTTPKGDPGFTVHGIFGGPGENESWIPDPDIQSHNKHPNKFEKKYPASFSTEDKSTDYDRSGSDEPAFSKGVKSAVYSSSSYEMNSHDFYGIGDFYVSSSESGLAYSITDMHSEATSTVTSPSSEEQSTDLATARSTDNDNEGSTAQEYTSNATTVRSTELTATNRTETVLESTTPRLLENAHYSGEITKSSEINIKNSLEDNQNIEVLDTKLDENVATWKLEQA